MAIKFRPWWLIIAWWNLKPLNQTPKSAFRLFRVQEKHKSFKHWPLSCRTLLQSVWKIYAFHWMKTQTEVNCSRSKQKKTINSTSVKEIRRRYVVNEILVALRYKVKFAFFSLTKLFATVNYLTIYDMTCKSKLHKS